MRIATILQAGTAARSAGRSLPPIPPPRRAGRPAPAGPAAKKEKKEGEPLLNILLWLVIVAVSSAILAGVGWMLANDLCALNKTPANEEPKEITVKVEEAWHTGTETFTKKDKNNEEKEYTAETYDMKQVASMLKEEGLIEYEWFFRLFSWVMHGERKVGAGQL